VGVPGLESSVCHEFMTPQPPSFMEVRY